MKGFFNIVDTEKVEQKRRVSTKVYDCSACGLDKNCITPRMKYYGKGKLKILAIAEAPGETEDERGRPLIGKAGRYVREVLESFGIDMDRDLWVTNALICRPPGNRKPTEFELKCCRKHWRGVIEKLQPDFIWLFGDTALDAFFMGKIDRDSLSISSWRRWCIPDQETGAWIIPMYHPSYVMRTEDRDELVKTVFREDLRWAVSRLSLTPFRFKNYEKRMKPMKELDEIIPELQGISDCILSFDYETSGLKPYNDGHRLHTIGLKRNDRPYSIAFPFQWPGHWKEKEQQTLESYWKQVLRNKSVQKVAHNIKFEQVWGQVILGVETKGWKFDTMQAAHILDVRPKLSGLKAQVFLRFGIKPYDDYVKPFFKMDANGFNSLHKADLNKVLLYQNKDAYYEDLLYRELCPLIGNSEKLSHIYHTFHEGTLAFADSEMVGFCTKPGYYDSAEKMVIKRIEKIEGELLSSPEAEKFKKKTKETLSLSSTKQLGILFYDVLGEKVIKKTVKSGAPALDEKTLATFKSSFAKKYVQMRRLRNKWLNTYVKAFKYDVQKGKIHPFQSLNTTETGRSSSDHPNLHNIPKRDVESMKLIRGGLMPRPGHEIGSVDYKQIEVSIQACYSHDKELIKYCRDVDSDMHRDQAIEIYLLPPKEISKPLRQNAKNGFVFPEIYGDWYKSIAEAMWKTMEGVTTVSGKDIRKHMREKGIKSPGDFEYHVKKVEQKFWNKFHATREWRDRMVEEYKKKMYVECFSGWRRNGSLSRNQICNTPVQNTAFYCLLWSYIRVNWKRKLERWDTQLIGQIHDQMVFDFNTDEKKDLKKTISDIMCEKIREDHSWIIVPLRVDFEFSGVDNSWAVKEEE